ncbi:PmoA family protein [Alteromonadaceae bacterium BrNp21-10]|nr:PmoA family protein [Alteromonadaceae bacterium BrNp21-10]
MIRRLLSKATICTLSITLLISGTLFADTHKLQLKDDSQSLIFQLGDKPLLAYHYGMAKVPEGIDPIFSRSGFIHPLWSPNGHALTQIQPSDHYHHYGIWNPWTKIEYQGQTLDFWNLGEGQGTVKFERILNKTVSAEYAQLTALHQHLQFLPDGVQKPILNEQQRIRIYTPTEADKYIVDIAIRLTAVDANVTLKQHRYGGFSWRATELWNESNSRVLTSEGKTRANADNSSGRWFLIDGELQNDYAGMLVMSHPSNVHHPEPLRIWPLGYNEQGQVFANFATTKNQDWVIKLGEVYYLNYRLVVYNQQLSDKQAESYWQDFASVKALNK